jgi:hypothetical protein
MSDLGVIADERRVRTYAWMAVGAYVLTFVALLALSPGLVDPTGKPIGYDFITFWSAGLITLQGDPAGAFDPATIFAMQRVAVPASDMIFLWHYPPTFQVVAAGLATMPYLVSYFVFIGASLALYLAVLRQLVPSRDAIVLLLAFPGAYIAFLHGQNSLLSAALIGGALISIDKRPILAGVLIGLLAYKPQLGLLFPLALLATGRWRAVRAAAATVVAYAGIATAWLGTDIWGVFLGNAGVVRSVMENGNLPWAKMPSAFIFLAMLGASHAASYVFQGVVAIAAAATTVLVWRRCGPSPLAGATLVAGTLLISPYTFDYELALLAIPLALVARDMVERGAGTGERWLLLAMFASPALFSGFASATHIQAGFLILATVFVWSVVRALSAAGALGEDQVGWLPGKMFSALS